ncbi:MAG: Rid family detoxifying hydrolase [Smithella sp.]
MEKKVIISNEIPVIGPYSSAVEANGFVFLSGQIPVNPATGEIIINIREATRQVILNIQTVLEEAGLSLSNILKTTIFLKDINDFSAVNEIYAEYFSEQSPARSTVEVSNLPKGAVLEIDVIAVKNR